MGRTPKGKGEIEGQRELFSEALSRSTEPRKANLLLPGRSGFDPRLPPVHTDAKSRLIATYLSMYQMVTHGGLYIDGFAGPQKREYEGAWTARRVLELEPKWIRHFWLCEMDPTGIAPLVELKKQHHGKPKGRTVAVMRGDFNESIKVILRSPKLRRATPIFALLDQRNTECHWSSVKAIAERAGRRKIELLYFLGTSWLHRSITQSKDPRRRAEISQWWGGDDWEQLANLSQTDIVQLVADRFVRELGYQHVTPWPVFKDTKGLRKVFYLIHASDHDEAPKLMKRAFGRVMGSIPGTPTDPQSVFEGL